MNCFSFDVFDTCLVRICGRPALVFDLLAERVLGKGASESMLMDFSFIRRYAEIKARKKSVSSYVEEITLDQIYEECDFSPLTNISKLVIRDMELELEKELLVPVYSISQKINDIHDKGGRVLFISDMYLPASFIKDLLIKYGLFRDGDSLFVSSDVKKTKSTGNLYRYIHENEQIEYEQWQHTGDNKISDYIIPRKLQIKANLLIHEYTSYEHEFASRELEGGKMNRFILSSISRSIRLSFESSPELNVACDFIAPIFVPFVYYIMEHASQNGINDLFFLSRDGFIFYKIAERFKNAFPDVQCHYLYVSRKALYLPSLDDFSYDSLKFRLSFVEKYTVETICERFQLLDDAKSFLRYNSLTGDELLNSLLNDDVFISKLKLKRDEQRELCIKYFVQEGLTNRKSAVIDLSGSRRCQIYINHILNAFGYNSVFGYYLNVTNPHIIDRNYLAMFDQSRNQMNKNITRFPQRVLEQYFCMSFHESTASYEQKGDMIIPKFCDIKEIDEKAGVVLKHNVTACQLYADYFYKYIDIKKSNEFINEGFAVLDSFNSVPDLYFVKAFENVKISSSSLNTKYIIEKKNFLKCFFNRRSLYWKNPTLLYNCCCPNVLKFIFWSRFLVKRFGKLL